MLSWKHGQLSEEVPSEICAALDSDERDENAGACNVLDRQITGHWSENNGSLRSDFVRPSSDTIYRSGRTAGAQVAIHQPWTH